MTLRRCTLAVGALTAIAGCDLDRQLVDRVPAPTVAAAVTGWLGNSSGAANDAWMPQLARGLHVAADGTAFVAGATTAPGGEPGTAIVSRGVVVGRLASLDDGARTSGEAITGSADHVFIAMKQDWSAAGGAGYPPKGTSWFCVRRYRADGVPAPFDHGSGYDGSMLVVSDRAPVVALATSPSELFAAVDDDPPAVVVYDLATLALQRRLSLGKVSSLTVDRQGRLWTSDGAASGAVTAWSAAGQPAGASLRAAGPVSALARDSEGRLLVAVGSSPPTVARYAVLDAPTIIESVAAPPPPYSPAGPDIGGAIAGVGADAAGRLYVAQNASSRAGARLTALAGPTHAALWEVDGLVAAETAAVDPASDGTVAFTRAGRFRLDLARADALVATWTGWTLDSARHPGDGRMRTDVDAVTSIARVAGVTLLAQASTGADVFRLDSSGDLAVPLASVGRGVLSDGVPDAAVARAPAWLWQDADGDGMPAAQECSALTGTTVTSTVDGAGTIWRAVADGVRELPLRAEADGRVHYVASDERATPLPHELTKLQQVAPLVDQSVVLAGFSAEHPNPYGNDAWTTPGTELVRYDGWHTDRHVRWRVRIDDPSSAGHRPCGFAVAGGRVFVAYAADDSAVHVWNADDGSSLGTVRADGSVHPWLALCRRTRPLTAYARRNGEVLLFAADAFHAKVTILRLPPLRLP